MSATTPYLINHYDGRQLATVGPGQKNTGTTDLTLFGHGFETYGEDMNENFIRILENFCHDVAPLRPINGQLWYNRNLKSLRVYLNGEWIPAGVSFSSTAPVETRNGALWFDSGDNSLKIWSGIAWEALALRSVADNQNSEITALRNRVAKLEQMSFIWIAFD